mmetsp:Transcript_140995/g.351618  ORF Transcript_140995/g.351618 Transcript_140995/m.351618 type:complete len:407 (+) Transcript_140995:154-1374(+)
MRDNLNLGTFRPYNSGAWASASGLAAGGVGAWDAGWMRDLIDSACCCGRDPGSGRRTSARGRRKGCQTRGSQTRASGSEIVQCCGRAVVPTGSTTGGSKSVARRCGVSRVTCSIQRALASKRDTHALVTQAPAAHVLAAQAHGIAALVGPAPAASAPAEQRPIAHVLAAQAQIGAPRWLAVLCSFCSTCVRAFMAPSCSIATTSSFRLDKDVEQHARRGSKTGKRRSVMPESEKDSCSSTFGRSTCRATSTFVGTALPSANTSRTMRRTSPGSISLCPPNSKVWLGSGRGDCRDVSARAWLLTLVLGAEEPRSSGGGGFCRTRGVGSSASGSGGCGICIGAAARLREFWRLVKNEKCFFSEGAGLALAAALKAFEAFTKPCQRSSSISAQHDHAILPCHGLNKATT